MGAGQNTLTWRLRAASLAVAAGLCVAGPAAPADVPTPQPRPKPPLSVEEICTLISAAAEEHGLPKAFFARLLYQESRFDAKAISPVGAQGIAQFMPYTAKERGLADPWDPAQAIPASAHFLADLRAQFGNFGLAAAAYNGGPNRVAQWLRRGGFLPAETRGYVRAITFRPVDWFRKPGREVERRPLVKGKAFDAACHSLPILPTRAVLGKRLPWGVQIAGGRSRAAALRSAKRVRSRFSSVLGGRPITVVRNRRGIRGLQYQARIGAASRKAAGRICSRLKRAGGACVVLRN